MYARIFALILMTVILAGTNVSSVFAGDHSGKKTFSVSGGEEYCDWNTDPTCKPDFDKCVSDAAESHDLSGVELCYILYAPCEFWDTCPKQDDGREEPQLRYDGFFYDKDTGERIQISIYPEPRRIQAVTVEYQG